MSEVCLLCIVIMCGVLGDLQVLKVVEVQVEHEVCVALIIALTAASTITTTSYTIVTHLNLTIVRILVHEIGTPENAWMALC